MKLQILEHRSLLAGCSAQNAIFSLTALTATLIVDASIDWITESMLCADETMTEGSESAPGLSCLARYVNAKYDSHILGSVVTRF
jgi:hypothetical protein